MPRHPARARRCRDHALDRHLFRRERQSEIGRCCKLLADMEECLSSPRRWFFVGGVGLLG
jgi:hypothetical protein